VKNPFLTGLVVGCAGAVVVVILVEVKRPPTLNPIEVIRQFNSQYYDKRVQTWGSMTWFGIPTQKYPTDMWIYQEIVYEVKPDLIIEAGTFKGGSALYLAHLLDQLGKGSVVTFDITDWKGQPKHPRIAYFLTSSTSEEAENAVKAHIKPGYKVLVILDSDHSKKHVLNELMLYAKYVTPGSYLIVEDTNVNGHPVYPEFGPGPMEAVEDFLRTTSDFRIDSNRERLMLTTNPKGYLQRVH
jgi:cephalosporin hydroxylase